MSEKRFEPPFDGKPCPMCPTEVRNLAATAHNLLNRYDDVFVRGQRDACSLAKFHDYVRLLREAVEMVKPLSDAHFADPLHSHGAH
jgi:hypothetical protein